MYLFSYTLEAILDFVIFDISSTYKKCNPFFSWSSWYFESESSKKIILTDKMHESVICDIWAYTKTLVSLFIFMYQFWAQ